MVVGIVGLGRMGAGIARRLRQSGIEVFGYDRDADTRSELQSEGLQVESSLTALVQRLEPPRLIWLMVPAGAAVEETIAALVPLLEPDDTIVDGGNSHYEDSLRRHRQLEAAGLRFLDVGTSGGTHGEATGYCLMIGGRQETVTHLQPVFTALAADGERGWQRVGAAGSGHFVKMIHNGIEYGMMQSLAEGFALLEAKSAFDLDLGGIAELWRHGSVVRSWLLDLLVERLAQPEELQRIAAWVGDTGEGRWTVQEALDLQVPAPVITASLIARIRSRRGDENFADRLLAALRQSFGGHGVVHGGRED